MTVSAMRGVPVTLQSAATTGSGTPIAIPSSFRNHTVILKGSAGINAGKVKVEMADAPDYAGAWTLLGNEVTLVASTELAVVISNTVIPFLRANISTTVSGGTVDVLYIGF